MFCSVAHSGSRGIPSGEGAAHVCSGIHGSPSTQQLLHHLFVSAPSCPVQWSLAILQQQSKAWEAVSAPSAMGTCWLMQHHHGRKASYAAHGNQPKPAMATMADCRVLKAAALATRHARHDFSRPRMCAEDVPMGYSGSCMSVRGTARGTFCGQVEHIVRGHQ
jgi:hypothetical protein